MKIGFVLPSAGRVIAGGLKVIYEYANALAKKGHQVVLYVMADSMEQHLIEFPVRFRRMVVSYAVQLFPTWFKLEKEVVKKPIYSYSDIEKNDVIIATAIRTAYFLHEAGNDKGRKAYFIQGFENWSYTDEQVVYTYKMGMKNIVVSRWLKEIVDKYAPEPSILIGNTINTNIFYPRKQSKKRKQHTVAFHYRSAEHKGCQYAFETISMLADIYSDLEVYIVSTERCPRLLPRYCRWICSPAPQKVAEINNACRIFMCTSIREGFGLPGLEAMACGCVLVSTNYEGVLEYAIDGFNALLSPVRDAKSMAQNVEKLFEDDCLYEQLRRNGIRTAKKRNSKDAQNRMESILLSMIEE